MAQAVATAAAEGDRSENAEYIYSKKKLAEIDRRLRFLGERLDVLTVVHEKPRKDGRVYFGCYVTLEDEEGALVTYRIVGPDETGVGKNLVSVESPMAKALLGKKVGDEVVVERPRGRAVFVIDRVEVDPFDEGEGGSPGEY
jgi:transcription elongation factor GreB